MKRGSHLLCLFAVSVVHIFQVSNARLSQLDESVVGFLGHVRVQDHIAGSGQYEIAVDVLLLHQRLDVEDLRSLKCCHLDGSLDSVLLDVLGHIEVDIRLHVAAWVFTSTLGWRGKTEGSINAYHFCPLRQSKPLGLPRWSLTEVMDCPHRCDGLEKSRRTRRR